MILTNECRYSITKIKEDLNKMGIDLPENISIYTSAMSLQDFLVKQLNKKHLSSTMGYYQIGVIGEIGLISCIQEVRSIFPNQIINVAINQGPNKPKYLNEQLFLVIGTVNELEINHLNSALKWIRAGAKVIITCPDIMDPELKEDFSISMPRHLLHMVRLNEGTDYFCVGKPNAWMARVIRRKFENLKSNEILYVGDTIQTDIVLAEEQDFTSVLVLSGNTKEEDIEKSIIQPDFVFNSVMELANSI
jgi:ribonucleotide monophosphatase NagD (HAD superfamily)